MGNEVSSSGDVYSYGMLLLEMLTGKRPTDEMFKEGLNLHRYGEVSSWKQAREILDTVVVEEIKEEEEEESSDTEITASQLKECVVSMLRVGVVLLWSRPVSG